MLPAYIDTYNSGELLQRSKLLNERLSSCDICPRRCGINRYESNRGFCRSGHLISVASYCDHHGEEPAISGFKGSGTIFFNSCNLKCIYCQNHQISQGNIENYTGISSIDLAEIMLTLQNSYNCHNINLVSPSHFVPQIIEAIIHAIPLGLHIPLVYNTNAYDSMTTLQMLDAIIDIYLPDIKYSSDSVARKLSNVNDYVANSHAAIMEMYRQVGNLIMDDNGIAQRGLIIRHLILPGGLSGSEKSLEWIAQNISSEVFISLMSQYYPCHIAKHEHLLARKINYTEYFEIVTLLEKLGISNGWVQELSSADTYLPDFSLQGHPFK